MEGLQKLLLQADPSVPGLKHLEVRRAYQGMDYALYSEFESPEALADYAVHPLHLAAKEQFHHMLASRVSVDYVC